LEKENSRGLCPRLVENQRKENLAIKAKPGGRKTLPCKRRKPWGRKTPPEFTRGENLGEGKPCLIQVQTSLAGL